MENFYFTFGVGDPINKNKFIVIQADSYLEARNKMFDLFGNKWAFCYSEEEWFINPLEDPNWLTKARLHGLDPNRKEAISQAEIYNLTEIKW